MRSEEAEGYWVETIVSLRRAYRISRSSGAYASSIMY
jgi:hypothetical protein